MTVETIQRAADRRVAVVRRFEPRPAPAPTIHSAFCRCHDCNEDWSPAAIRLDCFAILAGLALGLVAIVLIAVCQNADMIFAAMGLAS